MKELLINYPKSRDTDGYSFVNLNGKLTLKHSNFYDDWNLENCHEVKLVDTANEIHIHFQGRKKIILDYAEFADLFILLKLKAKDSGFDEPVIYTIEELK